MDTTTLDPNMVLLAAQFFSQLQQSQQLPAAGASAAPPPSSAATSYVSARPPLASIPPAARGHPNPTTMGPPAFSGHQPFLGPSSLAVSMTANSNQPRTLTGPRSRSSDRPSRSEISEANNSRNQAIETHFPSAPSLVRRRRRRGPAQALPILPPDDTSVDSIFEIDQLTNQRLIHIEVHVHLPTVSLLSHRICDFLLNTNAGSLS